MNRKNLTCLIGVVTGVLILAAVLPVFHPPAPAVLGQLTYDRIRASQILDPLDIQPAGQSDPVDLNAPDGCEVITDYTFEQETFAYINQERQRLGLAALIWNDDLALAARRHSADMACKGYFGHVGLDGSTFDERIAAAGYAFSNAGENLYAGWATWNTPYQAYIHWVYSKRHYAVMTHPDLTEVGIGYVFVDGSTYEGYFSADFGAPAK